MFLSYYINQEIETENEDSTILALNWHHLAHSVNVQCGENFEKVIISVLLLKCVKGALSNVQKRGKRYLIDLTIFSKSKFQA